MKDKVTNLGVLDIFHIKPIIMKYKKGHRATVKIKKKFVKLFNILMLYVFLNGLILF